MDQETNILTLWEQSGGDDLTKGKSFQQIFDESPNKHEAFILQDYDLRCNDEGTIGGVHLAGSGILYPDAEEDFKGKVSGIYSHTDCEQTKTFIEKQNIQTASPDTIADQAARELAERMHVPYLGRIEATDLKRPLGIHIARVIYYDGTGHFNPTQAKGFPNGFVISRKYIRDLEYAKSEVEMAIQSILNRGFAEKFSDSSPLYLVAVSDDKPGSVSIEDLVNELKPLLSKFLHTKIDSIKGITDA